MTEHCIYVDGETGRAVRPWGHREWNDSAMFKNHTKRSHTNVTETATEAFGVDVTVTTNPITKGNVPQRNPVTLPPRKCLSADEAVPETGEGAAAEGSVPHSTPESSVPSLKSRASQVCVGSRRPKDVRELQSELQEAAPRTYTILVSVEWDLTRLSEWDFSDLVGVFYEEAAPKMVHWLRNRGLTDAEDVVQNLFLTILRSNTRGRRAVKDFLMWAHRCASRFSSALGQNILRASRHIPICDRIENTVAASDRPQELREMEDEIETDFSDLKPDHRSVLELQYIEGLSHAEIGSAWGRSTGAIKSLSSRAREKVRIANHREHRSVDGKRNSSTISIGSLPKPTSRRP